MLFRSVVFEDRLTIDTPEGVPLELTLAGVGSRFASALVDYVIQFLILAALAVLLAVLGFGPLSGNGFASAMWVLGCLLPVCKGMLSGV